MNFPTATASYFALNELLVGRPDEMRTARLLVEVTARSGKIYPAGTEVRVSSDGSHVDGFVGGDWLSLDEREFAAVT